MSKRTKPDGYAFNHQVKNLVDKHFRGELEPAARTLGVNPVTLRGWIKGTHIPGFQRQVDTLRKLRSL